MASHSLTSVQTGVTGSGTAYTVQGEGPDVVLIHGLGLNRAMWQWQLPALTGDYRVLTYDLYGHGESAKPPRTASLTLLAEQLLDVLHKLDMPRSAVLGFSLGGMIARRFAMDYPHIPSALGILNSPHQRSVSAQAAVDKRAVQVRSNGPASTVDAAIERWFSEEFCADSANAKTIQQVRTWVLANDPAIYPDIYDVLATGVSELVAPANSIACPALVLTADDDFGQPAEMAYAIAEEIPHSKTVILRGLRHMALVEDYRQCNKILREFLDDVLAAT